MADVQGKGRLGEGRKLLSTNREGRCGKLRERMWKRERKWYPQPQKDTHCKQLAPGTTKKRAAWSLLIHPTISMHLLNAPRSPDS